MPKPVKSRLNGVFALLLLTTLSALPTTYAQPTNDKPIMDYWYGLMAPAGTLEQARNALYRAALEVLSRPEMIADLSKQGLDPTITTEKEFAAFVQTDMAKWAQVVKAADIKADQ